MQNCEVSSGEARTRFEILQLEGTIVNQFINGKPHKIHFVEAQNPSYQNWETVIPHCRSKEKTELHFLDPLMQSNRCYASFFRDG